jgi:hypothetical protein
LSDNYFDLEAGEIREIILTDRAGGLSPDGLAVYGA